MIWKLRKRELALGSQAAVMGVLNITPDSFSDGGEYLDRNRAIAHGEELVNAGADIIDVGGESTRPGSEPVSLDEEMRRVLPVVEALRARFPRMFLSVDTSKAEVARATLAAGADAINDVTALRGDPKMAEVVRGFGAGVVLMHMQGVPKSMQEAPQYQDFVEEVNAFLKQRLDFTQAVGIDPACVVLDPGFGFGKRLQDNIQLLRHFRRFTVFGRPIVAGVSRKSGLALLAGNPKLAPSDRLWPTVALTAWLREQGASIFRVHDVAPNRQAVRMIEAIVAYA
ncbi:MAG: dihydropteroate synthase [Verrucomicrobia bacterium]|nr:dihydropteroate synthase [Verrucomicrobiota bacterium]